MAETNLKIGDVVSLKSGSCLMTISKIKTEKEQSVSKAIPLVDNEISIVYFFEGKIERHIFFESQLELKEVPLFQKDRDTKNMDLT